MNVQFALASDLLSTVARLSQGIITPNSQIESMSTHRGADFTQPTGESINLKNELAFAEQPEGEK